MKRARIIGLCLGLLLLLALLVFLLLPKPVPVAIIRVVDAGGKPVSGAIIQPDGLRPKLNGGHYSWTDRREPKPRPVVTDTDGVAAVPYPPFVESDSFVVLHTEYELPVRKDSGQPTRARNVHLTPGQTNRQTVLLQKGGTDFLEH